MNTNTTIRLSIFGRSLEFECLLGKSLNQLDPKLDPTISGTF